MTVDLRRWAKVVSGMILSPRASVVANVWGGETRFRVLPTAHDDRLADFLFEGQNLVGPLRANRPLIDLGAHDQVHPFVLEIPSERIGGRRLGRGAVCRRCSELNGAGPICIEGK